ncbi:MAG TPA: thioesterase domain-containing protein, partial [Rhizomicrobium sp.]
SLGALLSFEVARLASAAGQPPLCVFLAACAAPGRIGARPPIAGLPEAQFIAEFDRLGAIPREVLADPGLRAMALRVLRADMTMLETYRCESDATLACPMLVLGGAEDAAARPRDLQLWRAHAGGAFEYREFPGGHFFVKSNETGVADHVGRRLTQLLAQESQAP